MKSGFSKQKSTAGVTCCNNCGSTVDVVRAMGDCFDAYLCRKCIGDPAKLAAFREKVLEHLNSGRK